MSAYVSTTAAAPTAVPPTAAALPTAPADSRPTDADTSPSWFLFLAAAATAHTELKAVHRDT